jgi:hypothetical protein
VAFKAHGGQEEDVERSMLEFLKGTEEFKLKEARDERLKKARADKKNLEVRKEAKVSKVVAESDEEVEYVLIKRKKPTETPETKKSKKKVDSKTPVTSEKGKEEEKGFKKKKKKEFFKKETLASLKQPVIVEDQEKIEEEASSKKGGKKKTGKEVEVPVAVQNSEKKAIDGSDVVGGEVKRRRNVGPRQGGEGGDQSFEQRPPRPQRPREAPLPPPKPMSGPYEAASLDDMLSAISTFYGVKPKENFFSKLPARFLYKVLHSLKVKDLITLSKVNHFLNKFCRDDKLWRFFFELDFKAKLAPGKKRIKNIYKEEYLKTHGKIDLKKV